MMRKDVKIGMFLGLLVSATLAGVLMIKGDLGTPDLDPVVTPESLKDNSGRSGDSAGSAISVAPRQAVQPQPVAQKVAAPAAQPDNATAPSPLKATRFHIIQQGDTLSSIAKKYYGTSDWKKIYEANKQVIENPDRPKVGTKLVIPN
jgi:nucleoid-associated protein YgaU